MQTGDVWRYKCELEKYLFQPDKEHAEQEHRDMMCTVIPLISIIVRNHDKGWMQIVPKEGAPFLVEIPKYDQKLFVLNICETTPSPVHQAAGAERNH